MRVQALDVTFMSAGNRFLCLDDFEVVGNAGGKTVLGLIESLFRQFDGTARDFDLLGGGSQIQQCSADFIVDAANTLLLGRIGGNPIGPL